MIGSYLRELVESNHRVIIPELGAFLKKSKGGQTLEETLTFSPFLRFNDGLLEGFVAKKENVEGKVAADKVNRFVDDVRSAISSKQLFFIEKLGAFYQDERGAVQFIYAETLKTAQRIFAQTVSATTNAHDELVNVVEDEPMQKNAKAKAAPKAKAKPKESTVSSEEKSQKNVEQLNEVSNALEKWILDVEERKKKYKEEEEQRRLEEEKKEKPEEIAKVHVEEPVEEPIKPPVVETTEVEEEDEVVLPATENDNESSSTPARQTEEVAVLPERKKSRGVWIILVLLLLLLAAAVVWFWEPIAQKIGLYTEQNTDRVELVQEHLQVSELPVQQSAVPKQQAGMFYVVAASLNFEYNAQYLCKYLQAKGLSPEIVLMNDGKYAVCVGQYRNRSEAINALDRYRTKHGQACIVP